jgi:ribosomal RNA-processing protein 17
MKNDSNRKGKGDGKGDGRGNGRGKGKQQSGSSSTASKSRNRGKEIVFDPEERRKYLQGFSERKRQRRAYGLAIQKVKDRKAKLEDRRDNKQSELERIEEAERQKLTLLEETLGRIEGSSEVPVQGTTQSKKTYEDKVTEEQWGGQVIVTTTVAPLSDDSDEEIGRATKSYSRKSQSIDTAQRYAGNVTKYMNQLKGSMPAKKKSAQNKFKKGSHGASNMKGIGGATNLKLAKKALMKEEAKTGGDRGKGKKKKKR